LDISGILSFFAKLKPDSLALVDDSNEITYSHLNSNVRRIARLLQNNEIDSSSLVCTMLPSVLDWQVTLALHILGARSFSKPIGSRLDEALMPDWLISRKLNPDFPEERTFVVDENFEKAFNQTERLRNAPGFASQDVTARYFFTSGTSGSEKYLEVSARDLFAKSTQQDSGELVGERDILNLFHFGANSSYRSALQALVAGRTYYASNYYDYSLPKMLSKYPIKTVHGSPIQISSMIDTLIQTGSKAPRIQTIVLAGSAPTPVQINRIQEHFNAHIYNSYGSTEMGFVAISKAVNGVFGGLVVIPEVKLQIVDSENRELPRGETGEIRYANANMPMGYINSEEATNKSFQSGFFYPGDLGFLDEFGHLHITGRVNEVLNLGGVKVSPKIVEDIALRVTGILDAAAFSLMDSKGIERLALAYVKSPGFELSQLEVQLTSELKSISVAKFLEVDEIPRNENGKIPRVKLAETFRTQGLNDA
jgi:acyl-coenzyme A synthetase/AMP-(fatty) acid ligase